MTPKRVAAVNWAMRSIRRNRRGLAEIVGTLMLVVIVVAAATAFSFFVAAYERQVLSEETQQHDRALETGRMAGIQQCSITSCKGLYCSNNTTLNTSLGLPPCASDYQYLPTLVLEGKEYVLNLSFVSGDVNSMFFTDYELDGQPPDGWLFYSHASTPSWMTDAALGGTDWGACQPTELINNTVVSVNNSCSEVPAYGRVNISLFTASDPKLPIELEVFTSLADTFSYSFAPPVPIIKTTVLPEGAYYEPLFDGSASYQPPGGDNASIIGYAWSFYNITGSRYAPGASGPQVEMAELSSSVTSAKFLVTLNVTNSDGLTASTAVYYQA